MRHSVRVQEGWNARSDASGKQLETEHMQDETRFKVHELTRVSGM